MCFWGTVKPNDFVDLGVESSLFFSQATLTGGSRIVSGLVDTKEARFPTSLLEPRGPLSVTHLKTRIMEIKGAGGLQGGGAMGQVGAGWGRLGQVGAGWGRLGQVGAGWGRLGQVGAGWGRLGQVGAGWGRLGQVGAGWGRLGQVGAGWGSGQGWEERVPGQIRDQFSAGARSRPSHHRAHFECILPTGSARPLLGKEAFNLELLVVKLVPQKQMH